MERRGRKRGDGNKENFDNAVRKIRKSKEENSEIYKDFDDKDTETERRDSDLDKLPKFNKNNSTGYNLFAFRQSVQTNLSAQESNQS